MRSHTSVWGNILQTIRQNVNDQSFRTWFQPIKPVSLNDNALTIEVPNKFFYEWLEEHYVSLLKSTVRGELGEKGKLRYRILMRKNDNKSNDKKGQSKKNTGKDFSVQADKIKNPFVIPGIQKMKVDPQLNSNYSFANFVEGDCNRLARSAGIAVSDKPGKTAFNPLFLYGDVGLGKTHLAHAIGNETLKKYEDKIVLYVSSEKFTNQIIDSIKNAAVNSFVNFYQMVDVLIVDDIQFLANRQKTQEIFFHIFNQLHQSGKQIILTSDRPPKDLVGMQERLISRFKWGLSADLQVPDFETRMAILETKMNNEGVKLPKDVIEFISYNIKKNIRELEGVLISLIAQSSLNHREIDLELTKEVIKNFVTQMDEEITVEFIQELVGEHFGVEVKKLQSKSRKRTIVIARQLSMYLAKKLTDKSLKYIGKNFGGRDHSTVIYSVRSVQDLMETDKVFKETVEELEKNIILNMTEK